MLEMMMNMQDYLEYDASEDGVVPYVPERVTKQIERELEAIGEKQRITAERTEEIDRTWNVTNQKVVSGMRRTAAMGMAFATVFGKTVDTTMQLTLEAVMLTVETVVAIEAALTAGTLGLNWATGKILMMGASVVALLVLAQRMRDHQDQTNQQMQGAVMAFRLLTY